MTRRPTSARSVPIGSYNYSLKLRSSYDDYPAAANVGSVVLTPVGDEHFADLFGESESPSHFTGNLSGNLEVKANTNEEGGSINLVIDGAVLRGASIRVAQPDYLVIWGDMDGDLEVTGAIYTGLLAMGRLDGSVAVYSGSIDGWFECWGGDGEFTANGVGLDEFEPGYVMLGRAEDAPAFNGTAKFTSIGPRGLVSAFTLNGTIHVGGDVAGYDAIDVTHAGPNSRINVDGSLTGYKLYVPVIDVYDFAPTAAITIDWDGWDGDDWHCEAVVKVGDLFYCPGAPDCDPETCAHHPNEPGSRIRAITSCRGDLDNNGSVNPFDVDGFVRALASGQDYDAHYPGLLGSAHYHGDADCNGTFNMFDVQPFLARVADGCCACGGCGFMMSGGPGGAGGFSAAEAAALFERYVDAALMDGWTTTIGTLAGKYTGADAKYWSDVLTYLENE